MRACNSARLESNSTCPAVAPSSFSPSTTIDARSGVAGVPRTLACASDQEATTWGGLPGSETASGPVNSAIRSFGSHTCATARISFSLMAIGGWVSFSSTVAAVQRTSIRNGKPPTACVPQPNTRPARACCSRQAFMRFSASPAA